MDDSRRLGQGGRDRQVHAEREHRQQSGRQRREVVQRSPAGERAAHGADAEAAAHEVPGADDRQRHDEGDLQQPLDDRQERQPEDVEARVPAEDRVAAAERRRVPVEQSRFPARRGVRGEGERAEPRHGVHHAPEARRLGLDRKRPLGRRDGELLAPHGAQDPARVDVEEPEYERKHRAGDRALGAQGSQEYLPIPGLPEPQPVGVELDQGGHHQHGGDEHEHPQARQTLGQRSSTQLGERTMLRPSDSTRRLPLRTWVSA